MAKKDVEEVKSFIKNSPVVKVEPVTASTVDVTTAEDKARAEAEAQSAAFQSAIKKIVEDFKNKSA